MTKIHDNRSAECSDPSCPCHGWGTRIPAESPSLTYYGHPRLDTGGVFHVSEAENVLSSDSAPNSPILTVEQALSELREIDPKMVALITIHQHGEMNRPDAILKTVDSAEIYIEGGYWFHGANLNECLAEVRKWAKEQQRNEIK